MPWFLLCIMKSLCQPIRQITVICPPCVAHKTNDLSPSNLLQTFLNTWEYCAIHDETVYCRLLVDTHLRPEQNKVGSPSRDLNQWPGTLCQTSQHKVSILPEAITTCPSRRRWHSYIQVWWRDEGLYDTNRSYVSRLMIYLNLAKF